MKTKYNIQKSTKSQSDMDNYCKLNELRNYRHKELETKDEKSFILCLEKIHTTDLYLTMSFHLLYI